MADSVSLIFRGIVIEDLYASDLLAQTTGPVLNVGADVPITPFLSAVSDVAAATQGAALGDVYISTAVVPYRLRAQSGIPFFVGIGATTLNSPAAALVSTQTVTGAAFGNAVVFGTIPVLPTGVQLFGKVTTSNTVTFELWNISGAPVTITPFDVQGSVLPYNS